MLYAYSTGVHFTSLLDDFRCVHVLMCIDVYKHYSMHVPYPCNTTIAIYVSGCHVLYPTINRCLVEACTLPLIARTRALSQD